jgi:type II secretion system protein I
MNSRGFTVMEILVALFIFSLVFLPLTELLVADSKFEKKYEQKQVAMLVAKNELEKAKRCYKKSENSEYQVTMAGKSWNVELAVEEKELAQVPGQKAQQPQSITTGEISASGQVKPSALSTITKQFITVRVSRSPDTNALAEFRVLKETYK